GIVTSLARHEGKPLGVIANDPSHLGGAIDAHGADKAARFLQLCDAFELPVLMLCDTPGFMVGPAAERTATVRHFARMFVVGANVTVPVGTIVLRKGYGLGAQAMAGRGAGSGGSATSTPPHGGNVQGRSARTWTPGRPLPCVHGRHRRRPRGSLVLKRSAVASLEIIRGELRRKESLPDVPSVLRRS